MLIRRTLALLIASIAPMLAFAEPDSSANARDIVVADAAAPSQQTVVVVGHYNNLIGTTEAASAGVVEGELLQDRPLLRPGEVLETIPGMVVTQHSGDGKANQYFLRGYNLDHGTDFATSVDGVPVNMPTNAHGQGYSDLNFLIPELVDEIDYRKGTYFAQNGDFSAAGSADISYVNSLDHPISSTTLGSFGYEREVFAGSASLDSLAPITGTSPTLLGALELMHDDGPWTVPEQLHKVNGLLRLCDGNRALGWSIDANFYEAAWHSTDQVPLALIDSGQLSRFSALDPTDGGDSGRDIVSAELHMHDANGYTKLSAFVEHYRLQLWSDFTFYELRPAAGDQFEQLEHRNILGAQLVHGWNHDLFGHDSVTEVGAQTRHDDIHVGLLDTTDRIPFATVSDNVVGETETAVYVQNSTAWAHWFHSLIGLRATDIEMDMDALNIPQNSGDAAGHKLLPKMALVFGPWDKTELFVDAGRGFHSNDARGVIDRIDPTTLTPASPVPALAGATGSELGLRTNIVPGLQSSLALWRLDSDSELVYNQDSDIGSTTANGASKRTGVEWNNSLGIGDYFLMDANLAWTHARYTDMNANGQIGDLIPNAVGKVASFGVTLNHYGPWSGELDTRYIGSYPLSQDGTLVAPSAIVTNLRVTRNITPAVDLTMDVLNLFNREYYDIAYEQDYRVTPTSPIVPTGITVHPGEPREARLTLKIRF